MSNWQSSTISDTLFAVEGMWFRVSAIDCVRPTTHTKGHCRVYLRGGESVEVPASVDDVLEAVRRAMLKGATP